MGASAFLKSIDFRAFAVNVKTIAPKKYLYQFGHAIWYYDMPMAVYSFLEEHDLSGKTIIPFVTSGGSGFSDAISAMKELEPDAGVVEDGFETTHSKVDEVTFDEVEQWVNDLGIEKK